MKREKILVIIPAYNEEENILGVIEEIRRFSLELDILVVDDGSKDRTKEIVRDKVNYLISLPFHFGLGAALQTGYIFTKENDYDFVIHFDADGQHIAEEIEKLIFPLKNGESDLVIGSRYLGNKSSYKFSFLRSFGTKGISKILYIFLNKRINDPTSGFRAMNRKVISLFVQQYPYDYPEIEELLILIKNRLRIKEVPVKMRSRIKGKSSLTFGKSLFYIFKTFLVLLLDIFSLAKTK